MTTLDTVTLPRQAGPVDAPLTTAPPAPGRVRTPVGKDRPRTPDERLFLLSINAMLLALALFSTVLIYLSDRVWG